MFGVEHILVYAHTATSRTNQRVSCQPYDPQRLFEDQEDKGDHDDVVPTCLTERHCSLLGVFNGGTNQASSCVDVDATS